MSTLAIYQSKGGVGKTATAVNLAYQASLEVPTLLVDLDPQSAATYYFRIKPSFAPGVKGIVKGKKSDSWKYIRGTDYAGLDLLPAETSFRKLDVKLAQVEKSVTRLRSFLKPFRKDYEVIILDCPPSLNVLAENIFTAADALIVPIVPTTLAMRTFEQLNRFLGKRTYTGLKLLPFLSLVDKRKKLHREISANLRNSDDRFLKQVINNSSVIERMGIERRPVGDFSPRSASAKAYRALWSEIQSKLT